MRVCATLPLPGRDLRLDLFRGLANWAIFLDHIPHEVMSSITTRNYGFSDAADLFVFISGYAAACVFGRIMVEQGCVAAASRLVKRASKLYAAHLILLVVYIATVGCVSRGLHDPDDLSQFNVAVFMSNPLWELWRILHFYNGACSRRSSSAVKIRLGCSASASSWRFVPTLQSR